jgi:hypothetical protein
LQLLFRKTGKDALHEERSSEWNISKKVKRWTSSSEALDFRCRSGYTGRERNPPDKQFNKQAIT